MSSNTTLLPDDFERVLNARKPRLISHVVAPRRAAVAAILRMGDSGLEVLLMERVRRASDRWSGQISFPGGMADPVDADLLDTAIRETHEEVGVVLPRSAAIGRSDDQVGIASGRSLPMAITPYVFRHTGSAPTLALGPEAADAFWLPLAPVLAGQLDSSHTWRKGPLSKELPCWLYRGHVIWGLTHHMLQRILDLALGCS